MSTQSFGQLEPIENLISSWMYLEDPTSVLDYSLPSDASAGPISYSLFHYPKCAEGKVKTLTQLRHDGTKAVFATFDKQGYLLKQIRYLERSNLSVLYRYDYSNDHRNVTVVVSQPESLRVLKCFFNVKYLLDSCIQVSDRSANPQIQRYRYDENNRLLNGSYVYTRDDHSWGTLLTNFLPDSLRSRYEKEIGLFLAPPYDSCVSRKKIRREAVVFDPNRSYSDGHFLIYKGPVTITYKHRGSHSHSHSSSVAEIHAKTKDGDMLNIIREYSTSGHLDVSGSELYIIDVYKTNNSSCFTHELVSRYFGFADQSYSTILKADCDKWGLIKSYGNEENTQVRFVYTYFR